MAGYIASSASATLLGGGDADGIGYATVPYSNPFVVGSTVSLSQGGLQGTFMVVDQKPGLVGLRAVYPGTNNLNKPNYGFSSLAAYAAGASLSMDSQFIYSQSAGRDVAPPASKVVTSLLVGGPTLGQQGYGVLYTEQGVPVSCSRSTTGSCLRSNGQLTLVSVNQIRVETAGVTGEQAHTNLTAHSDDFSQSGTWSPYNTGIAAPVITANAGVAVDGTLSAARVDLPAFTKGSGLFSAVINGGFSVSSGSVTWSAFLRGVSGPGTVYLFFQEFTTNTFTALACDYTTAWQRFSLTIPTTQGGGYVHFGVRDVANMASQPAQSFYICAGDVVDGAYARSHVSTAAAPATCAAGLVSLPTPAIPAAGEISLEGTPLWSAGVSGIHTFFDSRNVNSSDSGLCLYALSDRLNLIVANPSTSNTISSSALSWTAGQTYHIRCTWGSGGASIYRDDVLVASGSVTTPSGFGTGFFLGSDYSGSGPLDGHVSNLVISKP